MPARLRRHILTFYDFARAIDDVADTPALTRDEKLGRLDTFDAVLQGGIGPVGYEKAVRLRDSLVQTGVPERHARDLIQAFRQDAIKRRYDSWDALMAYCMLSAAPVGRYLLDLHGAGRESYGPSDALCCALQVLNHLQDCAGDYATLDRVYLPLEWMAEEEASIDMLSASHSAPALRRVLDRALSETDDLLRLSSTLAAQLRGRNAGQGKEARRLGLEAAVIQRVAERLSQQLRQRDPLQRRVKLGKMAYVVCFLLGVRDAFFSGVVGRRDSKG